MHSPCSVTTLCDITRAILSANQMGAFLTINFNLVPRVFCSFYSVIAWSLILRRSFRLVPVSFSSLYFRQPEQALVNI